MRSPEETFIEIMQDNGIDMIAMLPCDRIKNLIPMIYKGFYEIPLTREENGVGICAGAYMAGSKPMMVIQSTGLGNMINALESLNVICDIPLPILASWRGVYKEGIDAQKPLGESLPGILEGAGIAYTILDDPEKIDLLDYGIKDAYDNLRPHVILVSPKVWEGSSCDLWGKQQPVVITERSHKIIFDKKVPEPKIIRNDAISALAPLFDGEALIVNIGVPCKEMYAARDRDLNFYMFGSMGLASSIGVGVAMYCDRKVVVLDGDGSLLMNPNTLIEAARINPKNLIIVGLDNGAYGSTGSQETFTANFLDLELLAQACGIKNTMKVSTKEEIEEAYRQAHESDELTFIHVVLRSGNTAAPNIPMTPSQATRRFMQALE